MSDMCREAFEKQVKNFKYFHMTKNEEELRWSWWKLAWNAHSIASVSQGSSVPMVDQMNSDQLKECPFCGLVPIKSTHNVSVKIKGRVAPFCSTTMIICQCGVSSKRFPSEKEAVDFWNTRILNPKTVHATDQESKEPL